MQTFINSISSRSKRFIYSPTIGVIKMMTIIQEVAKKGIKMFKTNPFCKEREFSSWERYNDKIRTMEIHHFQQEARKTHLKGLL